MLYAFAVSLLSQADWLVLIMPACILTSLHVLAKVRHHNLCPSISAQAHSHTHTFHTNTSLTCQTVKLLFGCKNFWVC
jgi:hypothetical protein